MKRAGPSRPSSPGLVRDGALVLAGQVSSALAVLVSVRVLTEYLEPSDYGVMVLAVGIASAASAVVVWPLGQAVLVTFATFQRRGHAGLFGDTVWRLASGNIIATSAVLTLAGTLLAVRSGLYWTLGPVVGALFVLESRRYLGLALLMAARSQAAAALVYAGDGWLRLFGAWASIALLGASPLVALAGNIAGGSLLSGFMFLHASRMSTPTRAASVGSETEEVRREILARARPLVPSVVLSNLTEMSGRYIVAGAAGLSEAGIFSAALSLIRRPFGMLNSVTDWTLKPAVASAIAEDDPLRQRRMIVTWLVTGGGMAASLAISLLLLRGEVVEWLLADEYQSAGGLISWIVWGMVCVNVASVLNGISLVLGRARATLVTASVGAIATLTATFWLVQSHGSLGASQAILIASSCQVLVAAKLAVQGWRERRS